eukprot:CAMPEP_0202794746 /NCGR_PEP_ID=MMETSP1388-20130828/88658_1 /ASSEMBLY_ACC=CAM_ASM_000864 /TAXON_ID=37098 /ORGANISM="Isochrysis sp, Strain CCMP1244" /LENGTH=63 /DNA_ID=CAMNT_0049464599 /DNA_START=165 /DNA_END=353 /DNA_ORIENTATION=+
MRDDMMDGAVARPPIGRTGWQAGQGHARAVGRATCTRKAARRSSRKGQQYAIPVDARGRLGTV